MRFLFQNDENVLKLINDVVWLYELLKTIKSHTSTGELHGISQDEHP